MNPPPAAVPLPELKIPLPSLDAIPVTEGARRSSLERAMRVRESERLREYFAKEQEFKRLQDQSIRLREIERNKKILDSIGASPDRAPRVTARNPAWEVPRRAMPRSRPSTAAAPTTPRTSGVIEVEVLDRPPPAELKTPITQTNPKPQARPSSLPIPATSLKSLAPNAAISVVDFGFRVVSGQPIQQAAGGAVGTLGGSVIGVAAGTAIAGPIGGFVGGAIGGFLGGAIADKIFSANKPRSASSLPSDPIVRVPFVGGQLPVAYKVQYWEENNFSDFDKWRGGVQTLYLWGPIYGLNFIYIYGNKIYLERGNYGTWLQGSALAVKCHGEVGGARSQDPTYTANSATFGDGTGRVRGYMISVERMDGQPDSPKSLTIPIPKDTRNPDSKDHPLSTNTSPPRATPTSGNTQVSSTNPTPQTPPQNYVPGGMKSRTTGTPTGDNPNWIPHAGLKGTPHPVNQPKPLLKPLPSAGRLPDLPPERKRASNEAATTSGGENPNVAAHQAIPDAKKPTSGTYTSPKSPAELKFPSAAPVTTSVGNEPLPDANKPVASTSRPIGTGTKPKESELDQKLSELENQLKSNDNKVIELLTGLTTISALVTGLYQQNNKVVQQTTPEALQSAAEKGTCRTTQPGGCTTKAMNDAVGKGNEDLLNKLGVGAQGANLGLLNVINNKLGAQMPGGIAGAIGRLSKFLGIDRLFNLINFAANLHNALMLSNNLKITLLEMLSTVGNATGLLQTSENENVDLNAVYDQGIEKFMILIMGEENYAGLKTQWRKYNRIYQAAANSLNAISSMFNAISNVIEEAAEYTGKIGNALKASAAVAENSYRWMAEKFDAKSSKFIKFESRVNNVTEVLDSLNEIAESVVEGQEAHNEFKKANEEFDKAVAAAKKEPGISNEAVQKEMEEIKKRATKDPTGEEESGLLSFLTDL